MKHIFGVLAAVLAGLAAIAQIAMFFLPKGWETIRTRHLSRSSPSLPSGVTDQPAATVPRSPMPPSAWQASAPSPRRILLMCFGISFSVFFIAYRPSEAAKMFQAIGGTVLDLRTSLGTLIALLLLALAMSRRPGDFPGWVRPWMQALSSRRRSAPAIFWLKAAALVFGGLVICFQFAVADQLVTMMAIGLADAVDGFVAFTADLTGTQM